MTLTRDELRGQAKRCGMTESEYLKWHTEWRAKEDAKDHVVTLSVGGRKSFVRQAEAMVEQIQDQYSSGWLGLRFKKGDILRKALLIGLTTLAANSSNRKRPRALRSGAILKAVA